MKNNILRLIAAILLGGGTGIVIHNTTDTDIHTQTSSGVDTVLVAVPLEKHPFKRFIDRRTDVPMTIDIHHTATDTITDVVQINKFIINERGWEKLPYHFLVDMKGEVYFNNNVETKTYHNSENNTRGIAIAAIGNFEKYQPSEEMVCRIEELVHAIDSVLIIKQVKGHGYYKSTQCPGKHLENRLIYDDVIDQ